MAVSIFLVAHWLKSSGGLIVRRGERGEGGGSEVSLQIGAGKPSVHTLLLTIIYLFTVKLNNKLSPRPVKILNNPDRKY